MYDIIFAIAFTLVSIWNEESFLDEKRNLNGVYAWFEKKLELDFFFSTIHACELVLRNVVEVCWPITSGPNLQNRIARKIVRRISAKLMFCNS